MPLPIAALIGAGIAAGGIGNIIQGGAQKKAARIQADSEAEGRAIQREFFEHGKQATQPYRQAGEAALGQYQQLLTPEGQAGFFNQYQTSPMFQAFRQQAEESALRNASATGNIQSGAIVSALSQITPTLAMNAMQQRLGGLQSLYSTGANAASGTASIAPTVGANLAASQGRQGAYQGQAAAAMPNAFANTLGQLGGLAMFAGQGGFSPTPAAPALP